MVTRTDDVVREDLLGRLPAADEDNRLLIVSAPGGWGKSTLLGTWAQWATGTTFCRCPLSRPDNDPTRFINTLVGATSSLLAPSDRAWPDPGESSPLVWVEDTLPLLLGKIDTSASPVALVFDDYHVIDNPETHGIVQSLVETTGPQTMTVLSTRVDPPLRLARLRAARAVREVRSDDLKFTADDTDRLLRNTFGLDLDEAQIEMLVETTEGWPAAISLAAQSLRTIEDPDEFLARFVSSDRLIVDYLVEELLDTLPAEHQTFLHDTSGVERFVPPLASALSSVDDVTEVGEDLERRGLLRRSYDADRMWYRYHQLLRDVLHHRLDPETKRIRHLTAADWFVADDRPGAAIEQLIAGSDFQRAIGLILEHAGGYILRGRTTTVVDWIAAVADAAEATARLHLLGAQAAIYGGRVDQGRDWLARAEAAGQLSPTEQLLADAVRVNLAQASGRTLDAAVIAGELIDHYEATADELEADPGEIGECLFVAALGFWLAGEFERSEPLLDKAISMAERGTSQSPAIAALGLQALQAYLVDGDSTRARWLADQAFDLATAMDLPATALHVAVPHLCRVMVGSEEQVLRSLDDLRKINEYTYSPYGVATSYLCEAHYWMRKADEEDRAAQSVITARDLLDELEQPSPLAERYYEAVSGRLPEPASTNSRPLGPSALSDREIQVLRAFSSNLTQREIGRELYLSFNTIKTYARSAYRKLGVSSRTEAVRACREVGLF